MSTVELLPQRGYEERLLAKSFHPGWAKREPAMWPIPRKTYVPAVWRATEARAALIEACDFVSPEFAERRNLILANPISGNTYPSCATMVAAYQLVLPGETARSHRHTPNALRLVLDADQGMATIVNGVRVDMAPGDVILTPQWHWHGHENLSSAPAFWIDVLDVPLVQKLENVFFQHHPDTLETTAGADPDSPLRFKARDTLPSARALGNQRIGGDKLPTIALDVSHVATGSHRKVLASIDNRLLAVIEGALTLEVEPLGRLYLEPGDIAVIPSWTQYVVEGAGRDAMLLTISDAPVFTRLGFRDPTLTA